jgi:hypothetical protein
MGRLGEYVRRRPLARDDWLRPLNGRRGEDDTAARWAGRAGWVGVGGEGLLPSRKKWVGVGWTAC